MLRVLAILLLAAGVTLAWLPTRSAAEDEASATIAWHDDLDAARTNALREGRPLLVVFQ